MRKVRGDVTADRLIEVHTRLWESDVEEIKRQAKAAGELNWQPRLRIIIHEGVEARRVVK